MSAMTLGTIAKRQFGVMGAGVAALFVLIGLMAIGPKLEYRYFPVNTGFRVFNESVSVDGSVLFRIHYQKVRNCQPGSFDWYRYIDDETFEPVAMSRVGYPVGSTLSYRPLGSQISDLWRAPTPGKYFAVINYSCGLPWTTQSSYGPFTLGETLGAIPKQEKVGLAAPQ